MICRLMLNLRSIQHNEDDAHVHEVTSMSPLETYITGIGAALAYDGDQRNGMGRVYHSSGLIRPMDDAMFELRMLR